jgi:hypothetical protein
VVSGDFFSGAVPLTVLKLASKGTRVGVGGTEMEPDSVGAVDVPAEDDLPLRLRVLKLVQTFEDTQAMQDDICRQCARVGFCCVPC